MVEIEVRDRDGKECVCLFVVGWVGGRLLLFLEHLNSGLNGVAVPK